MSYYVYILVCSDNTFYTGITTDLERRVCEHNTDLKGSKYTRVRRPVKIVYTEKADSRSSASKREYEIKSLARVSKQKLVEEQGRSN